MNRFIRMLKAAVYEPLIWAIARVVGVRHTRDSLADVLAETQAGRAVLLDVRERSEWDRGHVLGAIFVPLSFLRERQSVAVWKKQIPTDRPVYIHCGAGGRSLIAASILAAHLYDARALKPGFDALVQAGFPAAS
ncbi:MAG: rhodanese-like domain-containing protein [Planctomycetaceae bacterium]|nr:rhodanese-like domain-containing protein [Planctomycetaceae bacterium]